MNPIEMPLWDAIDKIRETDLRYRREAYLFVVAALGVTVQALPPERLNDSERRHLSGRELVRGVAALARREFGRMASTVFREWGLLTNEDVGAIVFALVRGGQLSARSQDTMEDFRGGPGLLEALDGDSDPRSDQPVPRRSGPGGGPAPRA